MSYGTYKYDCNPLEGKDMLGKWIEYRDNDDKI